MSFGVVASSAAIASFAAAMIYSAIRDITSMTVSDRVVILLLLAFPILAPLAGWSLGAMGFSLAAALVAFFATLAFFAFGWMGGGDGKLIVASVLWVGPEQAFDFMLYTFMIGGVCALGLIAFRRLSLPHGWRRRAWIARLHAPGTGIPYAVAIGIAGLLVLPETLWMKDFT